MWSKEKIENQKNYFKEQRVNATGNFTEYVVRTFYCIYKSCDDNNTNYCLESDVYTSKIKYKIYEGFYGGIPDHDNKYVIGNCFKTLNEMGYISYDDSKSKTIIIVNKPLDFLLPDEHEKYKNKYNIKKDIDYNNTKIILKNVEHHCEPKKTNTHCLECSDGYYYLRKGSYGYFYGCSNYPKCKSTLSISDFIYKYLKENGINLYEKKTTCWKCKKEISVLSYFLDLDIELNKVVIPKLNHLDTVRLGMIISLDEHLIKKYKQIDIRFSKKAGFAYPANICPYCNNLQGAQMALGNIHELLIEDLKTNCLLNNIKETIKIDEKILSKEEIDEIIKCIIDRDELIY